MTDPSAPSGVPADVAAALAYRDLDLGAAVAALRSLALTTVAAVVGEGAADADLEALREGRRRGGAGVSRVARLASRFAAAFASRFAARFDGSPFRGRRIDAAAIDLLWPLVVGPRLTGRRRRRARNRLLQPLQHTRRQAEAAVTDLAVMAAAAAAPPSLRDRLAAALQPGGGLVAGAAILDFAMATAVRHPVFVAALDDILHRRLRREVVPARPADPRMTPIRLSERTLFTLIAMALLPRRAFRVPTRRSLFERAWNEHAAALWQAGDVPRDFEAWLLTEALRSRRGKTDRRLAAVARSAGLLGCPRFARIRAKPDNPVTDTVDYSTMPEPLARFLRCEF
ncbi:MAG: hypothetical protein FWD12_10190 [Alphaproteobacteria bacterium]|nr:hypothetical protein [Alphaproteobacteria bacterium]